ncbi:MAG: ABC transporter permease [Actinomycetota bacterium]|nr:ABC transporter permease [Actinomycetota bacterium]
MSDKQDTPRGDSDPSGEEPVLYADTVGEYVPSDVVGRQAATAEHDDQSAFRQSPVLDEVVGDLPRTASLWGDAWRQLRRRPVFIISAILIVILVIISLFPGLFATHDPRDCNLIDSLLLPSSEHWFGTDLQGCDYYSRTLYGTRVSISIGIIVVFFVTIIAVIGGSVAGYYGGATDSIIGRITDIWFVIPTILGGIVILSLIRSRGIATVSLVLIVLGWATLLRLVRSSVLAVKANDYVDAARAMGASNPRIIMRHILPNAIAPVIIVSAIYVGVIIAAEAALSFLGVGLQLPAISWGLMISVAQQRIITAPHLLLFPGAFLSVTVFSFILMGDALRDALDPKLR